MGSRRFPGKMLAEYLGQPLLRWVLERTRRSRRVDDVVLATTTLAGDDGLAELAAEMGVEVFRGDEEDVLGRFADAAAVTGAKTVVRVCADRPLIAPEMIDAVINAYMTNYPDYAFNHIPGGGQRPPYGLGAEVLSADLLGTLANTARDPHHREHVTSYIWDHPGDFTILAAECPPEWDAGDGDVRFDVDRKEDLDRLARDFGDVDIDVKAADLVSRTRGR